MEMLWLIASTRNIVRIGHGTGSPAENTAGNCSKAGGPKAEGDVSYPRACHAFRPLFLGVWEPM